jgi:shikimate kinase
MPRQSSLPVPLWQHVTFGPPRLLAGTSRDVTAALRESIQALERSDTAMRHVRRAERGHAPVVAVLGIDGSGKSTLSRALARDGSAGGRTCLIGDRLELFTDGQTSPAQPLLKEKLRRWVSAQAKDARSLARYKIPKLAELLLRDALLGEARRWYGPDAVFMDGSPILNMTAWSVLYKPELMSVDFCARAMAILSGETGGSGALDREFPELRVMKRLGLTRLRLPDAAIFLDVRPEVAMERIRSRGETVQVHETEEKLARLREAYLLVVRAVPGVPAVVLDGDGKPGAIAAEAKRRLAELLPPEEEE